MLNHAEASEQFIQDAERTTWHDETLWFVRSKRDKASKVIPEWEDLREHASQIKDHVLANLGQYLVEFEAKAKANGIHVHWAKDAEEHNQIVYELVAKHGSKALVKSKSMLTEECHLNSFLTKNSNIRFISVLNGNLEKKTTLKSKIGYIT